ncbi:MAG: PH domain-containing protein [Nitrospira sp.]|nr:PH domain-containing protein [Nitrospira sp.]
MDSVMDGQKQDRLVVWETFPSWAQFSWLYLMSALAALRGGLFYRFGVGGWEMWVIGAVILLACAAIVRHWVHYELTREQVLVRNGYTGRVIQSIPLSNLRGVTMRQGLVAQYFGIATLVIHSRTPDQTLSLRGVYDPEQVKIRIEALAWKHQRTTENSQPDDT